MATKRRKKSSHRRHRRRRRSMGAVDMKGLGTKVVGIAAAAFADSLARKNFTTLDGKILGIVEIGAGVILPRVLKSPIGEGISDGLIAVGTINLLKGFSVISGVGATRPAIVPLRRPAIHPTMPSIGAAGKPFLTQTVGDIGGSYFMPREMMGAMGALLYED